MIIYVKRCTFFEAINLHTVKEISKKLQGVNCCVNCKHAKKGNNEIICKLECMSVAIRQGHSNFKAPFLGQSSDKRTNLIMERFNHKLYDRDAWKR